MWLWLTSVSLFLLIWSEQIKTLLSFRIIYVCMLYTLTIAACLHNHLNRWLLLLFSLEPLTASNNWQTKLSIQLSYSFKLINARKFPDFEFPLATRLRSASQVTRTPTQNRKYVSAWKSQKNASPENCRLKLHIIIANHRTYTNWIQNVTLSNNLIT